MNRPGLLLPVRLLAVFALVCFGPGRLPAQPLNSPATPPAVPTNPPLPVLVTQDTNTLQPTQMERNDFILASARYEAEIRDYSNAEKNYLKLLTDDIPELMRKTALFEMAGVVRSENDLPRAAAIYTQYLQRWSGDDRTPEIFLRQGQIFREMGLPNLALAKFYGVMTTALSIKSSQIPYYKGVVLQAQIEIAQTHYLTGQFKDAVDYYSRLLAQNDPALDRQEIQFRLIRSLEAINRHDEAAAQAEDFMRHFPDSIELPEVRYHLAQAYKAQNRTADALREVRMFLQEEHEKTTNNPAVWSYWQQRVGNEIGNQLYQDGDYVKALQVYLALSQLDAAPNWQLPVRYQVGLTYEKLLQPNLAMEAYRNILSNAVPNLGTNLSPSLKSVIDMAGWRLNFLEWHGRADEFVHPALATTTTNLNSNQP